MKYDVKVQDRVVGTVERHNQSWIAISTHGAQVRILDTRTEAERYLVNRDTAQNSR